eukprot:120429-Amphidinium_carterae.3
MCLVGCKLELRLRGCMLLLTESSSPKQVQLHPKENRGSSHWLRGRELVMLCFQPIGLLQTRFMWYVHTRKTEGLAQDLVAEQLHLLAVHVVVCRRADG